MDADSSFIQCVIIHCYHYLMLELHDLSWFSWQVGDVIRDAHIVILGLIVVSAGLCFLTPSTRLCPGKPCCLGSALSVQCPCWGDRRPHTASPRILQPPFQAPCEHSGSKAVWLSPNTLFLFPRQLSSAVSLFQRRHEACYLTCEPGQSMGTSLTSGPQELLAQATL